MEVRPQGRVVVVTENELARALFGRKRREAEEAGSATVVVSATAVDSSSGGTVVVDFGTDVFGDTQSVDEQTGEVVYAPPSQGVEVPAAGGINAGDTVSVLVVDNQPVQAIGTGSVDRVGVVAEGASTTANEAKAVAEATGQHFWHDARGAHVTEAEREDYETQASGFQQLMTSLGTLLTRAVNGVEYLLRSDTQSGMAIYDGTCTADDANLAQHMVASFTAQGAQIGKSDGVHIVQHFNEMTMSDGNGTEFFAVRDLRNSYGMYLWVDTFTVNRNGTENEYPLTFAPIPIEGGGYAIQVNHGTTSLTYGTDYTLDIVSEAGEDFATVRTTRFYTSGTITVQLITNNRRCQNISLGGGEVGAMACAFGTNNTEATGFGSSAMGACARASGLSAHAEGGERVMSIPSEELTSIASGDFSHAEGVSWATGKAAHSEGYATRAQSPYSHTEGEGTVAYYNRHSLRAVHVEGRWNELDPNGEYAHIIGDGTSNTNRSNLHTVSGSGVAWYKNHGSVICSDDTNIRCAGQTIGSADNLSYVASEDTLRAPTDHASSLHAASGVNISPQTHVWRVGRIVIATINLNLTASSPSAAGNTIVSGFVPPLAQMNFGAAADNRTGLRMSITTAGNLILATAKSFSGYYSAALCYVAAS